MKNKWADGLRGLAALNVLISHFICAFIPTILHKNYPDIFQANSNPSFISNLFASPIFTFFYNGHLAVMVFFVLSGYVLTLPYYTKEKSEIALKTRLWGRYFRLNIPVATAILISLLVYELGFYENIFPATVLTGASYWLTISFSPHYGAYEALADAFYKSIFLGQVYFLPPLWSLNIEMIGSIYILAYYIVKPKSKHLLTMAFVFFILYITYTSRSIFFYPMFIGSLIYYIHFPARAGWPVFLIGAYLGAFQYECIAYDYLPQIAIWDRKDFYTAIGAVFITLPVINGFGSKFFESKWVQFLGRISYPLYLLHFIVLCSLAATLYMHFPRNYVTLLINFFIYLFVSIIIAKVFERFVDQTAIKIARKFGAWLCSNEKTT